MWTGEPKIDRLLLFYYAVSRDDLYSERQVKRVRNGGESAGKPKGPPATTGLKWALERPISDSQLPI